MLKNKIELTPCLADIGKLIKIIRHQTHSATGYGNIRYAIVTSLSRYTSCIAFKISTPSFIGR